MTATITGMKQRPPTARPRAPLSRDGRPPNRHHRFAAHVARAAVVTTEHFAGPRACSGTSPGAQGVYDAAARAAFDLNEPTQSPCSIAAGCLERSARAGGQPAEAVEAEMRGGVHRVCQPNLWRAKSGEQAAVLPG
jgi:hypothetical protein